MQTNEMDSSREVRRRRRKGEMIALEGWGSAAGRRGVDSVVIGARNPTARAVETRRSRLGRLGSGGREETSRLERRRDGPRAGSARAFGKIGAKNKERKKNWPLEKKSCEHLFSLALSLPTRLLTATRPASTYSASFTATGRTRRRTNGLNFSCSR